MASAGGAADDPGGGALNVGDANDDDALVTTPRMPAWLIARPGEHLTLERLRLRFAAYVYGNILVLTAIVISTGSSIDTGYATLLVAVTTLTTYLAHVISHNVGQKLGRDHGAHRPHMRHELQDALPIVFSGVVPVGILIVGDLGLVPSELVQLAAALWVVGRLAMIGFVVDRLSGRRPTWRTLSGGLVLALASAAVVVLKVLFAH